MGTKISKSTLLIIALLITSALYSQRKEDVKVLKKYALCSCINKNYNRIDSTFYSSDVTNSYIIQYYPLNIDRTKKLIRFIDDNTQDFYKMPPFGSYDAPKANMIFYFCMDFYESKKLDKFVKQLLKEKTL